MTAPTLQEAIENHGEENVIVRVAEFLLESSIDGQRGREARDFVALLIDSIYGEPCFEHSMPMSQAVSPDLIQCANYLAANIARLVDEENDIASLSIIAVARALEESYPNPGRREYQQIVGVLTSLIGQAHLGQVDLLGALATCRNYFFRKAAKPAK